MHPRLLGLAFLLWSAPCWAQTISLVSLGSNTSGSLGTSNILTVTADCPEGSASILGESYTTAQSLPPKVSDSGGNLWHGQQDRTDGTGISFGYDFTDNRTADLPEGGTITVAFHTGTVSTIAAFCVSGLKASTPRDEHGTAIAEGTDAQSSTAVNSGTLVQRNEIAIGMLANSVIGAISCSGFTEIMSEMATAPSLGVFAKVPSSPASIAFSCAWPIEGSYVADLTTYKAPVPMLLLGMPGSN